MLVQGDVPNNSSLVTVSFWVPDFAFSKSGNVQAIRWELEGLPLNIIIILYIINIQKNNPTSHTYKSIFILTNMWYYPYKCA